MYIYKLLVSALLISVLLIIGCSDDSTPTKSGGEGRDFTVTVSSGTTPQYSWASGDAFSVSVVRTATPTEIIWGIATPGQSNIASPANHGVAPNGAVTTAQSETVLSAGVEYRVSVTLLNTKTGYTDFTP